MTKYNNIPCYLYLGNVYFQVNDDGEIYYRSKVGLLLSEKELKNGLFFGSFLELSNYLVLVKWVDNFRKMHPLIEIKLIRQLPIVIIPESESFPTFKHRADFAIAVRWAKNSKPVIYVIESKGKITRDTMTILRLLEYFYKAISEKRYMMIFSTLPKKYPRNFPKDLLIATNATIYAQLFKLVRPA